MKTLVILSHPDIKNSTMNKSFINELTKYEDKFAIHELYKEYPNFNIDTQKEQKLLEDHSKIIIQFPLYWFSSPPLLKKWIDDVFLYGWCYGENGDKLENKEFFIIVTTGGTEHDYSSAGDRGIGVHEILLPFELTAKFVRAKYFYKAFYGANILIQEKLKANIKDYIEYVLEFHDK